MFKFAPMLLWIVVLPFAAASAVVGGSNVVAAEQIVHGARGGYATAITLQRVHLFPAGQGVFEFDVEESGTHALTLWMTEHERDDLLKTLVCSQIDSVHIDYETKGLGDVPAFERIARDPSTTLAEIVQGLRGQSITISNHGVPQSGILVGVEKTIGQRDSKASELEVVCLNTSQGLLRVPLDEASTVTLDSPELQNRLDRSLQSRQGRTVDRLPVTLHIEKKRPEHGSIVFAMEIAPWKCAYRLVATEHDQELQASAILDNSSGIDWCDVEVVLVVDQLLGFHAPLGQIADWGRDSMALPAPFAASPPTLVPGEPQRHLSLIVNAPQSSGGGMGGMGGMMGGGMGGMGGMGGFDPEPEDPFEGTTSVVGRSPSKREQRLGISFSASDLSRVCYGKRVHIRLPHVTLAPDSSTTFFLPKMPQKIDDVRVFDESIHDRHPLSAFDITLQEGYQLPGGPGAVWKNNGYSGDVMIPRLVSGVPQLVSHALDGMMEITHEVPSLANETTLASTWQNTPEALIETAHKERVHHYRIRNEGLKSAVLFVEHAVTEPQWKPQRSDASVETLDDEGYRFRLRVPASNATVLEVIERSSVEKPWPSTTDLDSLKKKLAEPDLDPNARQWLTKIVAERSAALKHKQLMTALGNKIAKLEQEQRRIKELLLALSRDDELHRRYLDKLAKLETELEQAQESMRTHSQEQTTQ